MRKTQKIKRNIFPFFLFLFCALVMDASLLRAQGGGPAIIRDTEIEAIFREWSQPLFKQAHIGQDQVHIILVQSPEINAFVADGANIFFYTGLIEKTDGPGEVIGVLAHELGHIAGGHLIKMREAAERASYESLLGTVLGLGAAIASGNGGAGNAIIYGSQSMAQSHFLTHSRVHESSADQAAYAYMSQAGLNPQGLETFLGKLESEELLPASQQSEYMRTHPITRDRIAAVHARVEQSGLEDKALPDLWKEQHARMKAKLMGFLHPEQVAWAYDDKDQSIAARYARVIAAYRQNRVDEAIKGIDSLLQSEPNNPYFYELKGQMLVDFGRINEGRKAYQKSVDLLPEAPLLRIALAHSLIEGSSGSADLKSAVIHLQRAVKKEPNSTRVHRLLATAYGRLGQEDLAKLHLAEEALLQRKMSYAKNQAEIALKGLKQGTPDWLRAKDILNFIAQGKT